MMMKGTNLPIFRGHFLVPLWVVVVITSLLCCTAHKSKDGAEDKPEDYYATLGIARYASSADVKKAYRKLSLENHPDKAGPDEAFAAAKKFHRISEAYEVLSKIHTRRLYDLYGHDFLHMEGYFEELPKRGGRELYRYKRGVFLLYERNLDGLLAKSPYTWILTFAQPGCGNCERNVPIYSQLGEKTMETENIRLAVVNCLMSNLCHYFGIHHLGQVFLLPPEQEGGGYWDKREYTGPLRADALLEAAKQIPAPNMQEVESDKVVERQLAGITGVKRPVSLERVAAADVAWLVNYHKPSCLSCRQAKSELRQVSHQLREKLTITFVNCDISVHYIWAYMPTISGIMPPTSLLLRFLAKQLH
ncbi:DnaJ domain-containing protein [Toxoplasma gondii TgCatPRC2]|uniref:DnaJ domain-containing protein n=5 Tax=Toxoplasma gondii TaxID=5811 RepID=B6KU15_TOXGV|nr:DnaJ domain-containing protein [Toxoplasma gondii ME49]EPT24752.1 DnaJ domain-containing protein [Toxoplasma gondii ME49]ESS34088.1 DnaJ domain-containing protein [Toxoplasma gondii VEG]KYK67006.1 DnaJ domain-containing protein [Toxoplasma gondii TgCatPRC2]CEL78236.1 TPA: DnaJ domain-containing protein [Toxoplasma gondii VEG]|eukprot:XP_002371338.1 DnaJ domain-containing protein [Toxoplasma gondii ME49]